MAMLPFFMLISVIAAMLRYARLPPAAAIALLLAFFITPSVGHAFQLSPLDDALRFCLLFDLFSPPA